MQDKQINLNAAALIGVLRSIENEHNEFNFLNIDLSNQTTPDELTKIAELIFSLNRYKELAIRNNLVYTNLLHQNISTQQTPKSIKDDKSYVVIGGTSGLGLETVKWLAQKGAKQIAIISRSGAKKEAIDVFDALTHVQVKEYLADVANLEQIKEVFSAIESHFSPIAGIVFAAGILSDGAFDNLSKEQFLEVIQIKATGAWNVHLLSEHLALDFFCLYSSAAGIFGSPGQSNYAAANTMLDLLAQYRVANGKTASTIDWGTIADVGLSAREDIRGERLLSQGVVPIYPRDLPSYFDSLILSDQSQIIALQIDFEKWASYNNAIRNNYFYKNVLIQKEEAKAIEIEKAEFNSLEEERKYIHKQIKQHIATVTKIAFHKIKEEDTFKSIGVDSLLALQIKNKLQEDFSLLLNISAIWSYPTVNKLTDFIVQQLKLEEKYHTDHIAAAQPSIENLTTNEHIEKDVKDLSLDELLKELSSKLDN